MAKNRYTRALKVLKNSQVDEKLQILESLPTNNTTGLYVVEPAIVNTVTVPGEVDREADFTQDGDGGADYDGTDTTGLFLTDGTILTIEPPGDTSYILGPMASMWYAWGNFTQIGYIRQSDRKMVNLARITGELGSWDGSSNFTSYGQLTLDQAVWFQGTPKLNGADNDTPNYRAFYPGPPSNVADEHGRYLCVITGTTKSTSREERQRTPDVMGDAESQGYPWERKKLGDDDKNDELMQLILNAAMLGLDIAAVVALLFPEPASSAAGAAHLATKLRYVAKLRRMRGALNPFGQRAVRSGAAGRRRVPVYSGRPYKGKRGFGKTTYGTTDPKTAATYSNPGPFKGMPGTGSRVNPKGTVDTGTLPQRYIDKYGSRSVLGQRQVKLGRKAAKRTFGEDYEYILEQMNNYRLFEETAAGNVSGMEAADGYVDEISKTSSPEQLEKASNDANNIAKEGGQGVSDDELSKVDKDAETEVKRITANINISDPESMNDDQLFDAFEFMYESNQDLTMELSDQFVDLIDRETLDVAFKEFSERKEYLSSDEYYRSVAPEYFRYKARADYLWDTFMNRLYTIPVHDALGFAWQIDGRYLESHEYDLIYEWSDNWHNQYNTLRNKIWPERSKQLKLNEDKYAKIADAAFRPHFVAIINAWNIMFGYGLDPFSLDEPVPHDAYGDLILLGLSAAAVAGLISAVGTAGVVALGRAIKQAEAIAKWYNKGRKPGEDKMSWRELLENDWKQRGKFGQGDDLTGWDLTRGFRPGVPADKGGFGSGPTPAVRQLIERPFRAILKFFESSNLEGNFLTEQSNESDLIDSIEKALKETETLEQFKKVMDTFVAMMKAEKTKKSQMESHRPKFLQQRSRQPLEEVVTSKQKRILREIKKPFEIKEAPTKFKVKPTGRNNKVVGAGLMKPIEDPKAFKPDPAIWKAGHKKYNEASSQDKKNHVLELVGASDHHWSTLIERSNRERQEKVNEAMAQEFDREMEELYEKYQKKETKVDKVIQSIKTTSLDKSKIKPVHPDEPPSPTPNGYHAKYGQKYKHDKLDPHSAEFMPDTGNPVIDANIRKATDQEKKDRKVRILRKPNEMS